MYSYCTPARDGYNIRVIVIIIIIIITRDFARPSVPIRLFGKRTPAVISLRAYIPSNLVETTEQVRLKPSSDYASGLTE